MKWGELTPESSVRRQIHEAPFLWSKLFGSCFKRNGPSSLLNLRLLFICITFLGAMLGNALMLLTYRVVSPIFAMLLVMVVIVALCAKVVGLTALIVDCGGSANSARGGLTHTASAVSGSLSNLVIGYFLDTPSLGYVGVFILTILASLLGVATLVQTAQSHVLQPGDVEEDREGHGEAPLSYELVCTRASCGR
eukprot:s173_g6.t1